MEALLPWKEASKDLGGSSPLTPTNFLSGRSSVWLRVLASDARGRGFKSHRPDQSLWCWTQVQNRRTNPSGNTAHGQEQPSVRHMQ